MEYTNYQAALFTKPVKIGDVNPGGEATYKGYARVLFLADAWTNIEEIVFPTSEDPTPQWVTHLAAIDGAGQVVGVMELSQKHVYNDCLA